MADFVSSVVPRNAHAAMILNCCRPRSHLAAGLVTDSRISRTRRSLWCIYYERENDLLREELEGLRLETGETQEQGEFRGFDTFSEDDDDDEFHDASQ